ncbi:hypothetical protein JAAARDRAFT_675427 [Jaapia argillacea MUCL 33604]|uniref:Methyltransferase domain-containing protein n=1 Tax=Jaapia argillacea MUCL 33604 TaxID=933084 RepID=A0A067PXP0_9AGAM|nr:hypothetical protein JAAARDRAFT_675427 [Jaapia argillacea MUCL 33604]
MVETQESQVEDLKFVHGRGMNSRSEVYKLPADSVEMQRLAVQHRLWKLLELDLYPLEVASRVADVLRSSNGERPRVLDLGSGSGIWTVEMANKFPDVEVIGFDLVKNADITVPSNCRFILGDLTTDLARFEGQFNLIHCRAVTGHLTDPSGSLQIIGRCLKPGGILITGGGDSTIFNKQKEVAKPAAEGEDNHGRSWIARRGPVAQGRGAV